MATNEFSINGGDLGFLTVIYSYSHNIYDNEFCLNAVEAVWGIDEEGEDVKHNFDKLPLDLQQEIEIKISEFLIFDANLSDLYYEDEE